MGDTQTLFDRDQFKVYLDRNRKERNRERDNWRMHDGTDFGQWDPTILSFLIQEGRPPSSFNFIQHHVNTLAGTFLADQPDVGFESELGQKNDESIAMKVVYLEDKEIGGWDHELLMFIRAGFVYRGWIEMFIDRTRDPRGRVGMRYVPGDRVIQDPDWNTHRVRDNKALYTWAWMSPLQIQAKYKKRTTEIENAILQQKQIVQGGYGSIEIDKLFDRGPEFYDQMNGLYVVAQKQELTAVTKKRLFDNQNAMWLPDMDASKIPEFMSTMEGQERRIQVVNSTQMRCDVRTICPGLSLDLVLEQGPHPLQLGTYPLFGFSSDILNGKPNTPVDILKDPQQTVNKRESTTTHILMTNANNGLLIESDITENPEDAHEIGKHRNRPGFYQLVVPGANSQGKAKQLEGRTPPTDFLNASQNSYAMSKELTPAVPAVQGVGEGAQSGVLFQSKVAQANVSMTFSRKHLLSVYQEIGDAYFAAFTQVYTYPMLVTSKEYQKIWALNLPGGIQVKEMSRFRVTVTQSVSSETFKRQLIQQYLATIQSVPGNLTKMALSRLMITMLPNVPEADLSTLNKTALLDEEAAKLLVLQQIVQGKASIVQLMQQMDIGMSASGAPGQPQLPPGMGGQGGGIPQGAGAGIPPELMAMLHGGGGAPAGMPGPAAPPRPQAPAMMPIGG